MKKSHLFFTLGWLFSVASLSAQPTTPLVDCSPFVQSPHPLNTCTVYPKIPYPERALNANIEGMVQVQIQVDAQGKYRGHHIVQSSHFLLNEALAPYIPSLEFAPAQHQGKAVSGCIVLPFIFRLGRGNPPKISCPVLSEDESIEIASNPEK